MTISVCLSVCLCVCVCVFASGANKTQPLAAPLPGSSNGSIQVVVLVVFGSWVCSSIIGITVVGGSVSSSVSSSITCQ